MNSTEKEISYQITNSYSTLNTLTHTTKYVWVVCHGLGYLSRYFLKYFTDLDADENYIIAPQAASKYYMGRNFKHVGACWLTKENTLADTKNIINYIDEILKTEQLPNHVKTIMLGYSQGVSIAARYVARRKRSCWKLVFLSGGLPKELTAENFHFFEGEAIFAYGNNDDYLNKERIEIEKKHALELFGDRLEMLSFEGKHEVKKHIINSIVK
ncbi:alpha/beta hydrolase [Changchengzhania lutea]|uniref:alpha/beta hydrolase n=1 Tax=Changchengzhania lutea TaxID=2049305 RepID=UPI00115DF08B|nr:alpha/beta hydrolase [Changchengzhania lutea]